MLNNTTNNVMVSLWNCNFHFAVIYEFYIISQYPFKYYEKYTHYQVHIIYLPHYFILLQNSNETQFATLFFWEEQPINLLKLRSLFLLPFQTKTEHTWTIHRNTEHEQKQSHFQKTHPDRHCRGIIQQFSNECQKQ